MAYQPRVMILDIENSMALGWFFGKVYETTVNHVEEQSYILSYSYSHYPSEKVTTVALCDFKGYKKGSDCEEELMKGLWELLNEADIVVGQNADAFDIKHINTRFAFYGITPPRPYKTVDTLKKIKSVFNLPSNKLDFVCNYFGLGSKLPHTGKNLWLACMNGDRAAWKTMKRYNAHDIKLTHKLYTLLLPWGKQPNINLLTHRQACPRCQSTRLQSRGNAIYASGQTYTRFQCMECGGWGKRFDGEKTSKVTVRT